MWPLTSKKSNNNNSSPILEACWKIRTRVDHIMADESCRMLTVTSTGKAEGKTTVAVNLARSYAQKNKKVLLIDANLRKPALHKVFGLSNSNGLTNILRDRFEKSEIIRYTMIPNLFLISSGPNVVDPIELLTSNQIANLLEKLKEEYDVIIVDTPPAMEWSDAQIVASMSDGALLVIKDDKVRMDQALKLKVMMEQVNARIVGAVLNNVSRRRLAN
ncbi:capsular exopolysaccharide synthesis family protein [Paenibacillus taihuensis]|uniref:non-specific protein-tyrosine kinase n=1 Tax=Paenibacillus taihuensis TaxID=1156355 RepID=A0A3D9Q3U5_9BACL|nr:CpsD/CapB family tyrosine-protein kinase [Paenibacillus taihuensis]REE57511.1 capsular exopolysaccharide synthesis family protein [Paenibacillus taihuensis]